MAVNSATRIVIPCRISFPNLFEPKGVNGSEPKYSVSCLIPETDTATLEKINNAIEAAKEDGKTKKWGGKLPTNLKLPLHEGSVDRPDDPAYEGMIYLNCSSKDAPQVVDRRKQPITDPLDVYPGCYCNVSMNAYAFSAGGNKGVTFGLGNVQFVKDGPQLAGRTTASSDFDCLDDDEDLLDTNDEELPDFLK